MAIRSYTSLRLHTLSGQHRNILDVLVTTTAMAEDGQTARLPRLVLPSWGVIIHRCNSFVHIYIIYYTYLGTNFFFLIILRHALSERPVDTCVVWVN
jgi:hypothetical protein